jgi:hypothetical protein
VPPARQHLCTQHIVAGIDSSCCNPPPSYTHKQLPGEDQDTIAARKSQHAWGAWITGDAPPPAAAAAAAGSGGEDAEEAGSGASEQTGRRGGGAEEVEEGQEVAGAAAAAAGGGRKGGRGKKAAQRDQVGTRVVAGAACAVVGTAR